MDFTGTSPRLYDGAEDVLALHTYSVGPTSIDGARGISCVSHPSCVSEASCASAASDVPATGIVYPAHPVVR